MREPGGGVGVNAVISAYCGCCRTGVGWLQGINGGGLDGEGRVGVGGVHGVDYHAGYLAGDRVVSDPVSDGVSGVGREEA